MQTIDLRNKFDLYRAKVALAGLFVLGVLVANAQTYGNRTENLINYDEEKIHYGFAFGGHASKYIIKYNEDFVSPSLDSLHSVVTRNLGGFKVGFIVNFHLYQYLDFRIQPTFGFYENELLYRFDDSSTRVLFKDATYFELPLLLKYKSVRRKNTAMYIIGGINPSLEAAASGDDVAEVETLETKNWNIAIDTGVGFDIYFPLFKFSPELRYSWGLRNMIREEKNEFNAALDKVIFHNLTFFITFEGGPSYLKKRNRRKG